ncbi:hypothetical protein SAMN00808754_2077 [Thermanaeromonas toyohensis ToBE]|uniref:Uncharacterized protein n=1 Tax=Thermanaeromonas toyohensis ToBE TaxID=698762 RepID=A0A1W1VY38_9FIRM|nr:hypothetical protein [Thermanaeromonas toyohensis]SMB98011.1 hypothetical protein SAMN00808754_2077 [Thermanaeromonas toyohensis ToBE]
MPTLVDPLYQTAVKHKKCWVCGNPNCPYPSDEDYSKALQEKWNGNPDNKECWMPIEEAS